MCEKWFKKTNISLNDLHQIRSNNQNPFKSFEIAKVLGVKPCTFSSWINAHTRCPAHHLVPISLYLDLPLQSLCAGAIGLMYSLLENETQRLFLERMFTNKNSKESFDQIMQIAPYFLPRVTPQEEADMTFYSQVRSTTTDAVVSSENALTTTDTDAETEEEIEEEIEVEIVNTQEAHHESFE